MGPWCRVASGMACTLRSYVAPFSHPSWCSWVLYSAHFGLCAQVEHEFHSYVRPSINTTLTPFCTKLTGITQDTVDAAPSLDEVRRASFCTALHRNSSRGVTRHQLWAMNLDSCRTLHNPDSCSLMLASHADSLALFSIISDRMCDTSIRYFCLLTSGS